MLFSTAKLKPESNRKAKLDDGNIVEYIIAYEKETDDLIHRALTYIGSGNKISESDDTDTTIYNFYNVKETLSD